MTRYAVLFSLLTLLLTGCRPAGERVEIARLDIAACNNNTDSVAEVFQPALSVLSNLLNTEGADSTLHAYSTSAAQHVFAPDIASRLGSLAQAEQMLGKAKAFLDQELPECSLPSRIYGYATPYNQSVVVADTIVLLGLNHYLGADYDGYSSFEPYQRRQKTISRIPFDVMEAITATQYPYTPQGDATALSRMLYDGAVLYAVKQAFGTPSTSELLGYEEAEFRWATENEGKIWSTLIESNFLYSTDPAIADRLLLPSPSTTIINQAAPGRLGRFTGLRIVESYTAANPSISLETLLSPSFYNSLKSLQDAAYAPK